VTADDKAVRLFWEKMCKHRPDAVVDLLQADLTADSTVHGRLRCWLGAGDSPDYGDGEGSGALGMPQQALQTLLAQPGPALRMLQLAEAYPLVVESPHHVSQAWLRLPSTLAAMGPEDRHDALVQLLTVGPNPTAAAATVSAEEARWLALYRATITRESANPIAYAFVSPTPASGTTGSARSGGASLVHTVGEAEVAAVLADPRFRLVPPRFISANFGLLAKKRRADATAGGGAGNAVAEKVWDMLNRSLEVVVMVSGEQLRSSLVPELFNDNGAAVYAAVADVWTAVTWPLPQLQAFIAAIEAQTSKAVFYGYDSNLCYHMHGSSHEWGSLAGSIESVASKGSPLLHNFFFGDEDRAVATRIGKYQRELGSAGVIPLVQAAKGRCDTSEGPFQTESLLGSIVAKGYVRPVHTSTPRVHSFPPAHPRTNARVSRQIHSRPRVHAHASTRCACACHQVCMCMPAPNVHVANWPFFAALVLSASPRIGFRLLNVIRLNTSSLLNTSSG
jgi:hypothetical protein